MAAVASFAQERLDGAAPNLTLAAEVEGPLDPDRLRRALEAVATRQETLRTRLSMMDGRLRQLIRPVAAVPLQVGEADGRPVPPDTVRRWLAVEATRPFALDQAPPIRAALLRVANHRHVLLITVHPVAADAWSLPILARELAEAYSAAGTGRPLRLPDLPVRYAEHAARQRDLLDRGAFDAGLAYWRDRLAGAPDLALPPDHRRPAVPSHRGAVLRFDLGPARAGRLRRFAASQDMSPFVVLLTGFLVVLARWTGRTDLVVGTPVANRRAGTRGLIGLFATLLALRVDLGGAARFRDCLHRTERAWREAYEHREAPVDVGSLVRVVFELTEVTGDRIALEGLHTRPVEVPDDTAPFGLRCTVFDRAGTLTAELRYATDLWQPDGVERLWLAWLTVLDAMMSNVDDEFRGLAGSGLVRAPW